MIVLLFTLIGSIVFGMWQGSTLAGIFMFFALSILAPHDCSK